MNLGECPHKSKTKLYTFLTSRQHIYIMPKCVMFAKNGGEGGFYEL
jgi:hypothetical protein